MHDIVHTYAVSIHTAESLLAMQQNTTSLLLQARPPSGFRRMEHAPANTFESYVSGNLHHHMKGSLGPGSWQPRDEWVDSEDYAVHEAVGTAMGVEALTSFAKMHEEVGDYIRAAQLLNIAMTVAKSHEMGDLVFTAVELYGFVDQEQMSPKDELMYLEVGQRWLSPATSTPPDLVPLPRLLNRDYLRRHTHPQLDSFT